MAVEASEGLRGLFLALTGMEFPKLNEDKLRALGESYRALAQALADLPDQIVQVTRAIRARFDAHAADAFAASISEFTSGRTNYVAAGQEAAAGIAAYTDKTATNVEYAKYMAIGQLLQLVIEIAWCIANAFRTFGLSLLLIPVYRAITSRFLLQVLKFLFQHLLAHVIINTAVAVSLDLLIQRIQIGKGTRDAYDPDLTRDALVGGVIEGLIAGPVGLAGAKLAKGFGRSVANRTGTALRGQIRNAAGGAGEISADALTQGVTNVISRNNDDLLPSIGKGLPLSDEVVTRLGSDFGDLFVTNFGRGLGEGAARDLGEAYGRTFARTWGDDGASDALGTVLGGGALPSGVRGALTQLPDTVRASVNTTRNTVVTRMLDLLGEGVEEGLTNTLADIATNLVLTGEFSANGWSFVSGLTSAATAGAGVAGGISGIQNLQSLPADRGGKGDTGTTPAPTTPITPITSNTPRTPDTISIPDPTGAPDLSGETNTGGDTDTRGDSGPTGVPTTSGDPGTSRGPDTTDTPRTSSGPITGTPHTTSGAPRSIATPPQTPTPAPGAELQQSSRPTPTASAFTDSGRAPQPAAATSGSDTTGGPRPAGAPPAPSVIPGPDTRSQQSGPSVSTAPAGSGPTAQPAATGTPRATAGTSNTDTGAGPVGPSPQATSSSAQPGSGTHTAAPSSSTPPQPGRPAVPAPTSQSTPQPGAQPSAPSAAPAGDRPAPAATSSGPDRTGPARQADADPIPAEQWWDRRSDAPASFLSLDWFDPSNDPLHTDRAPGTLHGRNTLVRTHIRRIQADDGQWIRSLTLNLPVRFGHGFRPEELPAFQNRIRTLLDTHINHGLRLPRSGDQLHIHLTLTPAPHHAEAIELSRTPDPTRSDQLHIRLGNDPDRDDTTALHEIAHYAGLRDRAQDPDTLFRRLRTTSSGDGLMTDVSQLPGTHTLTPDDLRTVEDVLDSGPTVRDHPRTTTQTTATPDTLPPDEHDPRWDTSQAPRDWTTPPSAYVRNYGSQHDGTVGLVHIEPLSADVVNGLHRQIMDVVGVKRDREGRLPDDHPVLDRLRDALTAEELARQLPYLRSSRGLGLTVVHGRAQREVEVRLALRAPQRSARYGAHSVEDPELRVERRGLGTQEASASSGAGTVRTVPVPWTVSFPVGAAGPVRGVDAALSLSLTHNQFSSSATVTQVVQTMTAQRSNELSQPFEFDAVWEVRLGAPRNAPPESWSPAVSHGPVTVWFPEHLAVDHGGGLPEPARLDDLPVWGVDTVVEPGRLLAEVREEFRTALAGLSKASAAELETFLSEPVLRGTLPMQVGGGIFSPVLVDGVGDAIGMLKLTTKVTPGTPMYGSVNGKINLEAHVTQTLKVDSSAKLTSGVALDGSLGPSFTADHAEGHPGASSVLSASLLGKAGVKWQTNASLAAGGSAGMSHAVRSNSSHLLVPAKVFHQVTLIRPRGGSAVAAFGPWEEGMHLRILGRGAALGTEHAPGSGDRDLPEELENLRALGSSAAPLGVTGTAPLFARAETWLREQGFLPPTEPATGLSTTGEATAQARLMNLRRFEQVRSDVGLRASVDAMLDGGHTLHLEYPTLTGTRRVQLRLTALRDRGPDSGTTPGTGTGTPNPNTGTPPGNSTPNPNTSTSTSTGTPAPNTSTAPGAQDTDTAARHIRTLPEVQTMGITSFSVGGTESKGYAYGWQAGFGGGPAARIGAHPLSVGGSADYAYARQTAHTSTLGSGVNQDQFFISGAQHTEVFEVPARFALDLYEGTGAEPVVRFAQPERHPDDNVPADAPADIERPAEPERPVVRTVEGHLTLAVPHHRTIEKGSAGQTPPPGRTVRLADGKDRARLAMTGPDGTPVPGTVRLPDDAVMDVLHGTGALLDAFHRAVTHTHEGRSEQRPADRTPGSAAYPTGRSRLSRMLFGADPTDQGTTVAEMLRAALSPAALVARAHQILKGGLVVEGLAFNGIGADHEYSVELRGVLHDPEYLGSAKQYLETDVGATDTAARQTTRSGGHQFAGALTLQEQAPKVPDGAPKPGLTSLLNGSARYAYSRRTDDSDTLTSSAGVTRTPTESGALHRIRTGVTFLLTVRHGRRSLITNSLGFGTVAPVTLAVELPRAAQFLLSDAQLARDAKWFTDVPGLTVPERPEPTLLLPDRFARTGQPGLAGVLSVRQFDVDPQNPDDPDRRVEQRDRLGRELTALVEREAPGSTTPGHSSYLPGVLARIADLTMPTSLRALPGRGPDDVLRFHFRHVALGGTRLVEVTLRARPEQDTAGLRTVRGRPAGPGTGQEQVHTHAPANTSNAVTKTRQHAVTANPGTRYPRPADDARTDRTGPAFTFTGTKAVTAKTAASAEDRHWMRTDSAVDADVRYRLEASVRSELVTEWPPQLPGGLLEGGVLAWYDDYADGRTITEWLNRTLHGRPARTVTVPAEITLRFTGSEAVPSPLPQPPARPTVSETRPTATGGRPLGQRIVPTGPAPVFHFDAYPQLAGALRAVAPRLESTWQSSDASGSAEAVAVRIGELVQAGEIALDPPRAAGLTGTLPGAYPLETGSGAPPTLRISLHNPRRITDTGDVALDRLRLPTASASTSLTAGTTLATVLQAAYAADDSSRHLVGVGLPLLAQQPVTQGPGSGTAATRREWAKTGGTAQPENQRGVRSHETRTDVVITVDGPAGTRYVSGTAELRLSERDILGHGITDARTDTQVYDLISMLADRPEPDLRDWTTHPLADLPRALADRLDPQERAAQVWLAPGPDPDGSRLARALYAASRTAVLADRPLELVLRADDGLWHWEFDPTGTLRTGAGEDTVRAAWTGLSAHLATHAEAAHAQADAMRREAQLRADRNGTRTALADAEAALATATAGHGEARAALAEAEAGRTAAETDLTAARREQREREAEIRELPGALLALPAKINEIQRQERAAARDAKTAGSIVQHIDQQPAGSAFPERSRAARERARAADEHLEAVTRDLAALRADQRDFQHRLNAARTATDPVPAREQALTEAMSTADGARARLDTATENLARATEHRDTLRDRVPSLGRDIDAALAAQTGHAAVQRAIEPELPRLAHALGTARHASGTGRVSVPLSSLAATPARAPGTAPRTLPHAAPSGEETISREEKAAAVRRAYADFFYARPGSPKFESAYYEFLDTQELTPRARQAATKDRALESMRIFHAQLEKIASDHATEATPIPHTPGEPVRIYRKMTIEEAKVIRGERTATAGLKKALKYNDSKQYRKFFTTSLSHTNVFSNANAASSSEVVVAFTLPWDGYWKFVRQYGTPNQKSGAYEIPHSALIHQERLRTGSAANFREQADVEAVVAGQTHHNIGIGQGNVGDFGRMVTDMTEVPPQEVARADQEAQEAAREERRKRAYELVRQKLAQRAAEGGVHGEPFTDGRAGTAAPEAESAEPVAVVEPLRPTDPDALVAELLSAPRAELPSRLELLSQGHRRWLASYPPFLDGMRTSLPTEDLARAAARLLTVVPEAVQRPVSARHETYAQVARMLRDPATALRMLRAGAAVVVLPRHVALTGLSSFAELHGELEPSGRRSVAELRGAADELTAAVPEENLLGERTPIGPVPHQPEGYSSATHEIAHLVHLAGLTAEDQELIGRAFQEKQAKGPDAEWPDGKRRDLADQKKDNYSATNEYEYFAQASTAYLGANHGTDTATGRARNNGPAWVRANEPTLGPLLERLYGPDPEAAPRTPVNPVTATDADNARYAAFHDFMTGVEERAATRPTAPTAPAPPAPVSPALVDATAHGEMSMPEPLDRREFVKQAISRPVAGSGHRPPLTVHASEQGTDGEPHNRRMVPDAADLERLRAARTPGDPAYRDGWERLTPSQSWALLAAEERGELFHAPEREAFARRIARLNASARTRYPVDDPERMDAILQAAHDHVRALPIASNQDLAARPDGTGPTRAEALTSDEHFRNFWSTGSTGGTFSRAGRGWVEELQGYGAALRRVEGTPQDGPGTGDFDPPAPDELPKYAALVSPAQHGGTYSYGSAVFYWKDPVRARVTHTPGDSADRGGRGVFSYTDNAHVFPLLAHGEDKRVRLALAEATGFRYDPGLGREVRELGHAAVGRYFETQIHGDLTWADVERIVLNWGDLYASNQRFTTRAEAESMAAFLRAFTTGRGLDLPVELGREIGEPDGAQRLADQRLIRLYDPQDGVGPEERALGEALDRRAARAPFLARATDQALLDLARLLGIRDPDPEQALPRLWRTVRGAPDLLDRSPQHLRWHAALNPPSDSDSKDRARHE
ncbi:WXG100-like domain-containing protein [Streptomyces sp. NPDC002920]